MWTSESSFAVACFLPDRDKDLSAPLYNGAHLEHVALIKRPFPPPPPCMDIFLSPSILLIFSSVQSGLFSCYATEIVCAYNITFHVRPVLGVSVPLNYHPRFNLRKNISFENLSPPPHLKVGVIWRSVTAFYVVVLVKNMELNVDRFSFLAVRWPIPLQRSAAKCCFVRINYASERARGHRV
jgi:hypothetical protein